MPIGGGRLEAVRAGPWKLHLPRKGRSKPELYDLQSDAGETINFAAEHAEVVGRLRKLAERFERDLRQHTRPVGNVNTGRGQPEPAGDSRSPCFSVLLGLRPNGTLERGLQHAISPGFR